MEQTIASWEKLKIVVELDPSLTRFEFLERDEAQAFRRYLLQYLNDLLSDLTIPVKKIDLIITFGEDKKRFRMSFYQLTINDLRCRLLCSTSVPQDVDALELARSVLKGIHQNLDLLISTALAERIQKQWSSESRNEHLTGLSLDRFHNLLKECIRRFFRIDRVRGAEFVNQFSSFQIEESMKEFSEVLRNKELKKGNAKKSFEKAISGWGTLKLRLFLPNRSILDYVEGTKTESAVKDNQIENNFKLMRDGLWYELGVMLPKVGFDIDENLKENEFRIQLNDLRLPPYCGLKQDHFLVNDTVDRLSLIKISGETAINPANGSECAIVRADNGVEEICIEAGLTTWDYVGFYILSLSAEIRRNADIFLTTETVEYNMDRLQLAFPALVNTVLKHFDIIELTEILRELLVEEISIRDFRGILETLLAISTHAKSRVDRSKIVESVRIAYQRYISNKCARGGNNIIVYLLDPDIERKIMNIEQPLKPGDEGHNQLIKAIYDEIGDSPLVPLTAVILTTVEVRKRLKNLIEKEFPGMAVLCYHELGPDMNIFPIGRIGQETRIKELNW
ncbi:MAG: FHIPEP family type III secretion protein [Candidatus Hermodarchaeota archaeon]